jgi:hypothetical protein
VEFDLSYGSWIVNELAQRDDFDEDVLEWLDDEIYNSHDRLYAVILAGSVSGSVSPDRAIPALIDQVRTGGDIIQSHAADSLVRLGTEEVVIRLRECFEQGDRDFRIYTAGILGSIKRSTSEKALMEVFPGEQDPTVKTYLARSLCYLLSERSLPLVAQMIDDDCYDRTAVDLREYIHPACTVCGVQLPDHLRPPKRREFSQLSWMHEHPQRTVGRKIGRNEPCPCGSGKKYKKCCGRPT